MLSQLKDDPFRTPDIAELVPRKVLYLAKDFRPFLFQARNDSFDIIDGECDVPDAQRIRRKLLNTASMPWIFMSHTSVSIVSLIIDIIYLLIMSFGQKGW